MHSLSPNQDLEAYLFQDNSRQDNRPIGPQNNRVVYLSF